MMTGIKLIVFALLVLIPATSCAPEAEPAIDIATVVANNASVRQKNSSTSRTLRKLNEGDTVQVLERKENWYRIRYGTQLAGWMEESTIVTGETKTRIEEMVSNSQGEPAQNTGVLRDAANFRIEPGRDTPIIRRLDAGTKIEILDRVTTPRPNTESQTDIWIKVRPAPTEVGWVYGGLLEFDVPVEIAQYTEGYTYAAVQKINQVQDPLAGPINWYVVGERRPGSTSAIDFDGIRVYTWNLKRHRYETAFRIAGIRGVYPLEIGQEGGNPVFRVFVLSEDGQTKIPREFIMYGVIVREKKDS